MKKLLFLAVLIILAGNGKTLAGQADVFSYDAVAIENQMGQLNQLEGFLAENPGTTLTEMIAEGNNLATLINGPNGISGFNILDEKVFGIPGFLWGCLLSVPGVVIVYFIGQDPAETRQAIIGCVVSGVAYVAWGVLWTVLGYSSWWY